MTGIESERTNKQPNSFDAPYTTPAVFIVILLKQGALTLNEAYRKLDLLSPFVSDDGYNTVKLALPYVAKFEDAAGLKRQR